MPRGRVISALAATGLVFVLLLLVVTRHWEPLLTLDRRIARAQVRTGLAHGGYASGMRAISDVFAPVIFHVVGCLAAIVLGVARRFRLAVWALLTTSGFLLGASIKGLVHRHRPSHLLSDAGGYSFPSGHALSVTLGVVVLVAVLGRRWAPVGAAVIAATCWSRVALGVHYLSDVLGGVALGLCWAALCFLVLDPISCGDGRSAGGSAELGRDQGGRA